MNKKFKMTKKQNKKKAFKIKKIVSNIDEIVKKQIQKNKNKNESLIQEELPQKNNYSSKNTEPEINFFYTNDKFINSFDDKEILEYIQAKYDLFLNDNKNDIQIKKIIILLLNDRIFMNDLLSYYNMTIQDFFKFLFRFETSVFKGPFLNKLNKIVKENKYI